MGEINIEWLDIPAGIFGAGSPSNEPERLDDETKHLVTLSAFKISKYAITFEQYDAFCDSMGFEKPHDEGWGRGNRPVINESWDDANSFAIWMGCRLPTEAEWEYACRAGTNTPFNTGNNLTNAQANYGGNKTLPVGSFSPNGWGLYDMHGNVLEWCSDWYDDYPASAGTNPEGPSSGDYRVLRGGAWNYQVGRCRSAYRDCDAPHARDNYMGFRLVSPM